ncbi:MAG TPA: hypothetical protein VGE27_09470 [Gemmatimonas sp.]|uniref:hypothetical protein n=1 Tax=Gemmatimonas sp. TaxID=1962908 RepID=UPI002EDB0E50
MTRPRELSDAERDTFWERASALWDLRQDRWYPLVEISGDDVVAFNATAFRAANGGNWLIDVVKARWPEWAAHRVEIW